MDGQLRQLPRVAASYPAHLLPTGVHAYDARFGGIEAGSLVGFCSQDGEAVADLCTRAVVAAVLAGANVALADFGGRTTDGLSRAGVSLGGSEIKRHAQAGVPVREIVARTEQWLTYDPALRLLVVMDLADLGSPPAHVVTELKRLARRLSLTVVVGSVAPAPGKDGRLLGHFAELPEPADLLLHLEARSPGPMFPASYRLHVRKARPHATVSIPVRLDERAGWIPLEATG